MEKIVQKQEPQGSKHTESSSAEFSGRTLSPPSFSVSASPLQLQTPDEGEGISIQKSVGEGGINDAADVLIVKRLMIAAGYDLHMIPAVGPKTIGFIKDFQKNSFGWKNPDGVVGPGGKTFQALAKAGAKTETKETATKPEKPQGLDYDAIAASLFKAMDGMGTDEAAIMQALGKIGGDAAKGANLKAAYQAKYGDLVTDLESELSDSYLFGNQKTKALSLLGSTTVEEKKEETKADEKPAREEAKETPEKETAAKPKVDMSKMTKQARFVMTYAAGAIALEKSHGVPAMFTLGQGALESGWGEKAIGNALFGIKANKSWKGKKQLVSTTEYHKDGKQGHRYPEVISITKVRAGRYKYRIKDYFRDYDSVQEGLTDHSRFLLVNPRYKGAFATETADDFAKAVAAAGYATDPNYATTLVAMNRSIKKHWPSEAGSIPAGNSKAITGGKPAKPEDIKEGAAPDKETGGAKKDTSASEGGKGRNRSSYSINKAVGDGAPNNAADALVIKELLIKAGYDLKMIPAVGPKTIGYIKDFQKKTFGWKNPDGVIGPKGQTFKALAGGQAAPKKEVKEEAPKGMDYTSMAEKLYEAMHGGYTGLGTDETAVYAELEKLGHDQGKIDKLKAAYKAKYSIELGKDIESEFSDSMIFGNNKSKALGLLTGKKQAAPKKEPKKEESKSGQKAGSKGAKLDQFYSDFSNIKVKSGEKVVNVRPPYYINRGTRKTNALAARKASSKVTTLLRDLTKSGKITSYVKLGKGQPHEISALLEEAVSRGLVTHDSAKMHSFLSKYGLSVDCSGYVSQALNFLMDGNMKVDDKDNLDPMNTSSGSLAGGKSRFTKVKVADLASGDTMHLSGHIRIVNEVDTVKKVVFFKTAESTGKKNGTTNNDGLYTRWWKYDGTKLYYTWKSPDGAHPTADAKGWKRDTAKHTYGRYKKFKKESE